MSNELNFKLKFALFTWPPPIGRLNLNFDLTNPVRSTWRGATPSQLFSRLTPHMAAAVCSAPTLTVVASDGTFVGSAPVLEAKSFYTEEFVGLDKADDTQVAAWLALMSSLHDEQVEKVEQPAVASKEVEDLEEVVQSDVLLSVLAEFGGDHAVCGKRVREDDVEEEEDDVESELVAYAPPVDVDAPSERSTSSMSRGKSPRSFEVRSPKSMKKMKFSNEQEEVQVRLFGQTPCRVDTLVRLVKEKKKNAWMKIEELRQMCAEAGYAGKSSVFSSVWCIKSSLYGRNKANGNKCEPWGHFFPYFEVRKDRPVDPNTRRPSTRQVTWVRLSQEFFEPRNLSSH